MRYLLDDAILRKGYELEKVIESDNFDFIRNYLLHENCISFQLPIGLKSEDEPVTGENEIVSRPIDGKVIGTGNLYVGQLKGRVLPVAAALFANAVIKELELRYAASVENDEDSKPEPQSAKRTKPVTAGV